MESPSQIVGIILFLGFTAFFIFSLRSWFRMMTAKTRQGYLKHMALFAGPILLLFAGAFALGLFPEMPDAPPPKDIPRASELLENLPPFQLFFLGLAAFTWIIGGNYLMISNAKRHGVKWYQFLNPLNPPFRHFEARDWTVLGALLVVSLVFGYIALSIPPSAGGT